MSEVVDLDGDEEPAGPVNFDNFQAAPNPGSLSSDNTASWCSNSNSSQTCKPILGKRKRGRPSSLMNL